MKLQDLLNAGYDVKQGQVFTMKDCPPFKTPNQIAEEEKLKEVTYPEFKADETQTPRQKVGNAIKEMNSLLFRMEQIIRQSAKLKNELDMNPDQYWRSTQRKLERVTGRVLKVAKHLKELKKESEAVNESVNENQKLLDKIGDKLADMELKGKENTPEYKKLEKAWKDLYKKIG